MVRPSRKKEVVNTSVINVKINENNEIEYMEVNEVASEDELYADENTQDNEYDAFGEDDVDDDDVDDEDGDPDYEGEEELIPNEDGTMTIKMPEKKVKKKQVVEHVCAKCSKSYSSVKALKRHLNLCRNLPKDETITTEDKDFSTIDVSAAKYDITCFCCNEDKSTAHYGHIKCNFCPKSFKSHISLERHLYTLHSSTEDYPCNLCNALCPTQEILDAHVETHETGKPFSCQNCGKDFTRKYHLDRHLQYTNCDKNRPKSEIPCHVCGKLFTRTDNLREHLRAHIGQSTRKKDYQCPHCEKSFYGSSLLNIHIRTHTGEKPFPCDLCTKSFPSNGALRKHRRMHTGEKPYTCKTCGKSFSAKETLNRHNKIHTGERPHVCEYCNKSFIQATQLRSHLFHHTGKSEFICDYCNVAFNRKNRLEAHIKSVHQQKNNYKCEECTEEFSQKSDLNRHRAQHKNSKKFSCDSCSKIFSSKQSLQIHLRTHVKEEPCKCKICNRAFIRTDCLIRHMRQKHKDEVTNLIASAEEKKKKHTRSNVTIIENNGEIFEVAAIDEVPEGTILSTIDEINDSNLDDYEHSVIESTIEFEDSKRNIVLKPDSEPVSIFMDDETLKSSVAQLLNIVVDEDTLKKFGWPDASIEHVLSSVIEQCGQVPADYNSCSDYTSKMRENVKLLFTTVIDNDLIKSMLNNNTIDEVINHVLKLAKS